MPEGADGVGVQRCEPLHPPVDGDLVDLDTTFGQQFFDVSIGQSVAEVAPDRDRDHLRWEPKPRTNR
jgi:hypothetical protein